MWRHISEHCMFSHLHHAADLREASLVLCPRQQRLTSLRDRHTRHDTCATAAAQPAVRA